MDYYYINTDMKTIKVSPHDYWISNGYAYTSGLEKYGRKLKVPARGDILFLYVNEVGVLAAGTVLEEWDGQTYSEPTIYPDPKEKVYRIRVGWTISTIKEPVNSLILRQLVGWTPSSTMQKIDPKPGARLLNYIASRAQSVNLPNAEELAEISALEGEVVQAAIKYRRRSQKIIEAKKAISSNRCEACGMSFIETYGLHDADCIIGHHINPIADRKGESSTKLADISLLCPNCHAVVHTEDPPITIESLQSMISLARTKE